MAENGLLSTGCFSFKIRGIGLHCQRMKEKGCTHFISASGGNAGLATAYAGKLLNVPTTVVVPASTSSFMADKIRQLGAQVLIHGQIWDEANEKAIQLGFIPTLHTYILLIIPISGKVMLRLSKSAHNRLIHPMPLLLPLVVVGISLVFAKVFDLSVGMTQCYHR